MTYTQHMAQRDRRDREHAVQQQIDEVPLTDREAEAWAKIAAIRDRVQRNHKLPAVVWTPERVEAQPDTESK